MHARIFSSAFFGLLISVLASAQQTSMPNVVFVCEHGAARSVIASVNFNKIAKQQGLPYQSVFRAVAPDSALTKETRAGLTADGFATSLLSPTLLQQEDIGSNTILISIDCEIPKGFNVNEAWKGISPISQDYERARNQILKQVEQLVVQLKNRK